MKKHSKLIVSVIGVLVILIVVLTGSKTYESHEQPSHSIGVHRSTNKDSKKDDGIKAKKSKNNSENDSKDTNTEEQSSEGSSSTQPQEDADPQEVGTALYKYVFDTDDDPEYCQQDGDKWDVGQGTADSTIPFQINGDTVTYWTQKDGEATVDGKNQENTISISELLGD